ncbi:YidC/Oxa1 family membrane protein insertase, partial [Waltera sp.]
KREKYNPLASLIPLAVQIILLMGLVEVIYHPLDYLLHLPQDVITAFNGLAVSLAGANPESSSIQLAVVEMIKSGNYAEQFAALQSGLAGVDIASVLQQVQGISLNFCGMNLSWVPSEVGGIDIIVPIAAGISAWLLCVAQNAANVIQAEQSKLNKYGMMAFSVGLSLYLGWFVPAGVALYWIASNLFAILQQYLLNWAINPKDYVDYEELEASKQELEELQSIGGKKKLFEKNPYAKREKKDFKRFFSVVNKHLVFYSESSGFYKYYQGIIEWLLAHTNLTIHYITSDPEDQIFALAEKEDKIRAYYIGEKRLITLMMKMDADVVVMTMPDIENFHIKRSYIRKDIEYIYIPHCMDSLNMTMRTGSMDHYDTVYCVGKHHTEEIRKTEEAYGLPPKKLIDWGYCLLDRMIEDYRKADKTPHEKKHILIAPSWQKDNIVDSCLEGMLDDLAGKGYEVVVRPHPQQVRLQQDKMDRLKERYAKNPDIDIQTDFSSNSTVFEADLLVTDWSGIAYEYAFTTKKPVLFVDTPMKVMNPEYQKIDTVPINIWMRDVIGDRLDPAKTEETESKVRNLLEQKDAYHDRIEKFVEEYVYNLGNSAEVGAKYIVQAVQEQIKKAKEQ